VRPEVHAGAERPGRPTPPRSEIGERTAIRAPVRPPGARLAAASWIALLVALGLAFEVAYGQAPLYSGDQHEHVLRGLAHAGVGLLPLDWLANTVDPTPASSLLVTLAAALHAEWLMLVLHACLIGVYGVTLVALGVTLMRLEGLPRRLLLVALLLAVHSWVATRLTLGLPDDVRTLATEGLAGQHAPGETFEPSLFGVLIVASLLVYARGRLLGAVALACAAAVLDPAYLIAALVLCAAYLADVHARARDARAVARAAALVTGLLVPVTVYSLISFAAAGGGAHAAAQSVLVDFRLADHAKLARWVGTDDGLRLVIVAGGLLAAWRTAMFSVLALSVAAATALTAVQVATGSDALALLSPWRLSVWLVPVSTALLLAAGTQAVFALTGVVGRLLARRSPVREARLGRAGNVVADVVAGLLIALSLVAGLPAIGRLSAEPRREPFAALVTGEVRPGTLVLVPPRLYEVRVAAGVPVYVDYRSHPYSDLEVLEWRRRLRTAARVYRPRRLDCRRLSALAAGERVTHVVAESRMGGARCSGLEEIRRTGSLALFRLEPHR